MQLTLRSTETIPQILLLACGSASLARADPAEASSSSRETEQGGQAPAITSHALRAAAATDPLALSFYKKNGWHPVWSDRVADALMLSLNDRARHGLDRLSFLPERSKMDSAQREVAMTAAALRYAAALARGVTNPENLHSIYTLARPQRDLIGPLSAAIT
jgi:murein L,D-transpeptidase YcbB/YkuD